MTRLTTCRTCASTNLYMFLPLGEHPPANAFLTEECLERPEAVFPLDCQVCLDCALVEVSYQLPPGFFDDYVYVPSASDTMRVHFKGLATRIAESVDPGAFMIDIGCNDGLLLAACQEEGLTTLGIEPATNIAALARSQGVNVVNEYFTPDCAARVRSTYGPANVIATTNTFNHVDDLHGFMMGVDQLLAEDGTFIVEVPRALEFVENNEFDTVYHEHLSTFSVTSIVALYRRLAMRVTDLELLPIHGGSMRLYGRRDGGDEPASAVVQEWLDRERAHGLFDRSTYDALAERAGRIRSDLLTLLWGLKAQGKRLAGYGAPAKGNTLLNFARIGPDTLDFLADRNQLKQGRYSPGMRIPVVAPEHIAKARPDYLLILAWNFADEIMGQLEGYRRGGGKFIIPIPEPRIVD